MTGPEAARLLASREAAMRGFFASRVSSREDAEDLLGEAACAAIVSAPRLRDDGAAGAWLFGICRNVLHRYYRTKRRARVPSPDPGALPDRPFERLCLELALERLSPRLRLVYEDRYVRGLGVAEIAKDRGLPEGTVKYRLYELRSRLRETLGD
jgi:RNA polymerase sigma factor (sigma-70 family)